MKAEIVALAMSEGEALERIERVKSWMGEAPVEDLIELHQRRAWVSLGLESWDVLCDEYFGGVRISLPTDQRRSVVGRMTAAGMSTRAIASATGVSKNTVQRDQSTVPNGTVGREVRSLDGKTRTYEPTALDDFVSNDPTVRALNIKRDWHRTVARLSYLAATFDPVEMAEILPEPDEQSSFDWVVKRIARWNDDYRKACRDNQFKVIDGGAR